jgi:hypothetical protein
MEKEIIPVQKKGASFDVHAKLEMSDREIADGHYQKSRQRLLDINNWGVYSGEAKDTFILTDYLGNAVNRPPVEGDHVKVHLPGPRLSTGDGADWVVIEKIAEERNKILDEILTAMTLRPCPNPHLNAKKVAHFYEHRSTNTLIICRHKTEIISSIHGRNEVVNTDINWIDFIRNLMVALPAKAGLSNPHWKKLAKGLIAE